MDEKSTSTLIWLDNSSAEQFVLFQKYFASINLLIEKRIFDQKAAVIQLHFDKQGEIVNITRNDLLYLKGVPFLNQNDWGIDNVL